ncbi:MAG: PEP-CTERM sorting domain-containing protein [Sedimentisphaerales bacterium]
MKKLAIFCAAAGILLAVNRGISAETITFTAADIVSAIGGLSNTSFQWGLWGIRTRPIVTGGSYTITGSSTSQAGYSIINPPNPDTWPIYGTNYVYFYDVPGAEWGYPANPRYMIMDRPADTFTSYPGDPVTKVMDSASFSFIFTLDSNAIWNGQWQFLVDGTKYTLGTVENKGVFVEEFRGGYGSGSLPGNTGQGYTVPEPTVVFLLGQGLSIFLIRRRRAYGANIHLRSMGKDTKI